MMANRIPDSAPANDATCIGCACTDAQACAGGCHWLVVDRLAGRGVCSNCQSHLPRFESGDLGIIYPPGEGFDRVD